MEELFFGTIIAIIGLGALMAIATWICRRGYRSALADIVKASRQLNTGIGTDPDAEHKIVFLSAENEKLVGRIGRLEERIAVMERIVTEPGHATARAIEQLR